MKNFIISAMAVIGFILGISTNETGHFDGISLLGFAMLFLAFIAYKIKPKNE